MKLSTEEIQGVYATAVGVNSDDLQKPFHLAVESRNNRGKRRALAYAIRRNLFSSTGGGDATEKLVR